MASDDDARFILEAYTTFTASPGWRLLTEAADSRKRAITARIVQEDASDEERATLAAEFRAIEAVMDTPRQEVIRAENQLHRG